MKIVVLLGILAFVVGVVFMTTSSAQSQCEVCMEFDGEMVCRKGAGATEEEARRAAQESACGGNAMGMSELIICRGRQPDRVQCSVG
jgi:hypothetical protein